MIASVPEPLILWYTPVPNVAGVGRHVRDVARAGIPGFRVVFAVPEGHLADALRAEGAAVVTGRFGVADGAKTATSSLRRTIAALRPAIVHSHLAFADFVAQCAVLGMRAAGGGRVRVVSTEHGIAADPGLYQANRAMAGLKLRVHALRMRRTDRVIAVSESTRDQVFTQWGSGAKVTVIPNGVDRPESVAQKAGLRVLSLARLSHEKRIESLIDAFALVHAEHSDATLTVAGEGPLQSGLEAQVGRLGLTQAVSFPGFVDADATLRNHDVVVQLSAWENLSYTLLDATAYGLGVVATPVGGNPEIVPERCLVAVDDAGAVGRAIVQQGLAVSQRPELPASIPTVVGMCEQIAAVYGDVLA